MLAIEGGARDERSEDAAEARRPRLPLAPQRHDALARALVARRYDEIKRPERRVGESRCVNRDDLEQGGMPFPFPISMIVSRHAATPPPDGDAGTGDDA